MTSDEVWFLAIEAALAGMGVLLLATGIWAPKWLRWMFEEGMSRGSGFNDMWNAMSPMMRRGLLAVFGLCALGLAVAMQFADPWQPPAGPP